jgi:hypothetical protein
MGVVLPFAHFDVKMDIVIAGDHVIQRQAD